MYCTKHLEWWCQLHRFSVHIGHSCTIFWSSLCPSLYLRSDHLIIMGWGRKDFSKKKSRTRFCRNENIQDRDSGYSTLCTPIKVKWSLPYIWNLLLREKVPIFVCGTSFAVRLGFCVGVVAGGADRIVFYITIETHYGLVISIVIISWFLSYTILVQ